MKKTVRKSRREDRRVLWAILVSGWLASTSAVGTTAVKAMAVRAMATGTTDVGTALRATRAAAAPDSDRALHVERWLKAVLRHEPGSLDEPASEIAAWSNTDLSTLWIDLKVLIELMRNPRAVNFAVTPSGEIIYPARGRAKSLYSSSTEARLRILACAAEGIAGGIVPTNPACAAFKPVETLDADLRTLASAAAEGRGVGADNYVLKRGALLMADIATLSPKGSSTRSKPSSSPFPMSSRSFPVKGSRSVLVKMSDGQATDIGDGAVHWAIAQTLLDAVRTRNGEKPAPQRDPMVRDWYRATAAWLLLNRHYIVGHLEHALMLFPDDSAILFLAGSQHEAYATSKMQNVVRSVNLPPGTITLWSSSDRGELREAESLLRRSIGANGEYAEAHLRLGRVLALQGRFADARPELQKALEIAPNVAIGYYGELFLAAAEESLGNLDAAAAGYERAAARFPEAQSPLMALASLSHRRGDRAGARRASDRLFSLPRSTHETPDPWWVYDKFQGVNADQLLDELRRPFASRDADR
jgi:tetratricopeptide (TPR) repeat protein